MARKTQQPAAGSSGAAAAAARSSKGKEKVTVAEKENGRDGAQPKLLASSMAAAAAVVTRSRRRTEEGANGGKKSKEAPPATEKQPRAESDAAPAAGAGRVFFKIFLADRSSERMKIPSAFQEYLEDEPNKNVSLKGPSGNTWPVLLTSDQDGLAFTEGWKKFASDHSLVTGQFLVFTYDGHSQFTVIVLAASGVEEKSAFNVQPSVDVVVKVEEEEGATDINVASMPQVSAPPMDEGTGTTRKRARQATDMVENGAASKRHSSVQKNAETRATIDASQAAPANVNNVQGSSHHLNDYSSRIMAWSKSKDIPRIGTFVSKKFRQPVMISQRRPITEEEKTHALERAKEFNSIKPFVLQVMTDSYVYVGFFMNIPCEFVRESLPRASKKMKLWDPSGQSWEVNYVYYHDRKVAAFSGGWGKFAVAHNLEKFDVCVFELIEDDNFKVHIYRVVQDLTPLIRKSNT